MFSELLLKNGYKASAVEPNKAVREEAEKSLATCKNFKSIDGKAEQTSLAAGSVDWITVAQAFTGWIGPLPKRISENIKTTRRHCITVEYTADQYIFFKNSWRPEDKIWKRLYSNPDAHGKRYRHILPSKPLTRKYFYHDQLLAYEALPGQLLSGSYIPLEEVGLMPTKPS